jgi:quinol monooxygenase YgiN
MDRNSVIVFAGFKAAENKSAALKRELMSLVLPTREEEGCIRYELHQDSGDPAFFMFYEVWRSQEDLDKHLGTPALTRLLGLVPQLCSESPMVRMTKKLA